VEGSVPEVRDGVPKASRILSRSHRRFTDEQKVKVFRSLIKETRISAAGVEFEMYAQPTQNAWWKYRQKKSATTARTPRMQTVRIQTARQLSRSK
jgi:hypothetical protein